MKFLLDENFPKLAIDLLGKKGYEVFDIRGSKQEGLSDINIFKLSIKKKCVFLTTDKDFYHTIHFLFKPHYGIVVIALSKPNSENIISKLQLFLTYFSKTKLNNKCILITDKKCKIYN